MTTFTQLGLSKPILDALAAKNYTQPTPIQRDAIPVVLTGRDLLGIAQTGTGKTAAFVLPSIDRLVAARTSVNGGRPVPGRARMLVLAPTRELAAQIAASARAYSAGQHISVGVIFGGVPNNKSVREVSRGVDILVATPGRLLDLVDQRALDLSALEILVLDEADQMLDLGFIHALKRIVALVPKKRQTLFFSATMPKAIRQLADAYCNNPAEVAVTPIAKTADRVSQTVTFVNQGEKQALLTLMLQSLTVERALVFSRTKHGADKIVRFLAASGISANAIHGNKSQGQRERALAMFRSGEAPILIATDIAARGIDIPGVSHVFNFDLPDVPEQYVHRIGRTARAGAEGEAVAFCSHEEKGNLRDIEKLVRMKLPDQPLPEGFMAAVAAIKRLKPAPKAEPQRNQRNRRNESGARGHGRDPQRYGVPPGRDPRSDMPSAEPRAHGETRPASGQRRNPPQLATGGQRHPQRADGQHAHRPDGGQPKRPFRGRRRPSGNRHAQA